MVLGASRSYTQNKETERKTRIEYENGQCTMCLWAPSDHETKEEEENKVLKGSKFSILATDKENTKKDFTRRV